MIAIIFAALAALVAPLTYPPRAAALAVAQDGSVWYVDEHRGAIAHLSRSGNVAEYAAPVEGSGGSGIAVDANGGVWFFHGDTFGTTDGNGRIIQHREPHLLFYSIAIARDGSVWLGAKGTKPPDFRGALINVTHAGHVTHHFLASGARAASLTADVAGNLWIAEVNGDMWSGRIAMMDAARHIRTVVSLDNAPLGIALGADGKIWFTTRERYASINRDGSVRWFAWPQFNFDPGAVLISGPNSTLWLPAGYWENRRIATIDMAGQVRTLGNPRPSNPLAVSPDGKVYFVEFDREHIDALSPGGIIERYRLPGAAPEPTFWDHLRAFWERWMILIVLLLPNIDSVAAAIFALLLIRLKPERREALLERMPMQSVAVGVLVVGTTSIAASLLAIIAYTAIAPPSEVPSAYVIGITACYVLANAVLLYIAIRARHPEGVSRTIARLGIFNAAVVAGELGLFLAMALGEGQVFGAFMAEITILAGVALFAFLMARSQRRPTEQFTGNTILASGLLNGGIGATALIWMALGIRLAIAQTADEGAPGFFILLTPVAMIVLFLRGVAAAWTAIRMARLRRPTPPMRIAPSPSHARILD